MISKSITLALVGILSLGPSSAQAVPACPELTILMDRSGSMMLDTMGNMGVPVAQQKWSIAVQAMTSLVTKFDGRLPLGLSLFAADNTCGPAQLDSPPVLFNAQQIIRKLNAAQPTSQTPTAASISSLTRSLRRIEPSRKHYLLLLTDGAPACTDQPTYPTESVAQAVAALQAAANDSAAPIKTFVVGFGNLAPAEHMAMNEMAQAGGLPANDSTYRYYRADSSATLTAALERILTIVVGDAGPAACDDTCYGQGCPNPNDRCIQAMCTPNPCAGVVCPEGQYCYTDGLTRGTCAPVCATRCPVETTCDLAGACVSAPCGAPCEPGQLCNPSTKKCQPDSACLDITCLSSQGCVHGKCVDNPCQGLITCPQGFTCTPWVGTCEGEGTRFEPGGCRWTPRPGQDYAGATTVAVGLLVILMRRRRRAALPVSR